MHSWQLTFEFMREAFCCEGDVSLVLHYFVTLITPLHVSDDMHVKERIGEPLSNDRYNWTLSVQPRNLSGRGRAVDLVAI